MEKINFLSTDGIKLVGILYESQKENKNNKENIENIERKENKEQNRKNKIIISTHGMTSNCFNKREEVISKIANENNIDY